MLGLEMLNGIWPVNDGKDELTRLARFKGGSSTTVQQRNIPGQTANEAKLENALLGYVMGGSASQSAGGNSFGIGKTQADANAMANAIASKGGGTPVNNYSTPEPAGGAIGQATSLLNSAGTALMNTYNPNWNQLSGNYNNTMSGINSGIQGSQNNYNNFMNNLQNQYAPAQSQYASNMASAAQKNQAYSDKYNTAMDSLNSQYSPLAQQYADDLKSLTDRNSGFQNDYNNTMAGVTSRYEDLAAGNLPAQFAAARQQALNADLTGTVGNAISSLANRGILNSSLTNSSMNDISRNASNTLAANYANDFGMYGNMLGQQGATAADVLHNNTSLLDKQNTNTTNAYQAQMDALNAQTANTNNQYSNSLSGLGALQQNYGDTLQSALSSLNAQAANANNQLSGNNASYDQLAKNAQAALSNEALAQQSSYFAPSQLYDYSNQLYGVAQNMYNTMYSGRMGTGSTQTTQKSNDGGSGMWGAIGTLGAGALLCFVAGTKIATPDGDKNIEDIKIGDRVCTLGGSSETVTAVQEPQISPNRYVNVHAETETIRTTEFQPFLTSIGEFLTSELKGKRLIGRLGEEKCIDVTFVAEGEEKELVYDFTCSGLNVYFANGFAVRGMY